MTCNHITVCKQMININLKPHICVKIIIRGEYLISYNCTQKTFKKQLHKKYIHLMNNFLTNGYKITLEGLT